ncbi:hypothetical protein PM082_012489 [Marasmius tenuissimus]|nr:hypothetical protein PM082_012489 [Marasmius tenuissimus]
MDTGCAGSSLNFDPVFHLSGHVSIGPIDFSHMSATIPSEPEATATLILSTYYRNHTIYCRLNHFAKPVITSSVGLPSNLTYLESLTRILNSHRQHFLYMARPPV